MTNISSWCSVELELALSILLELAAKTGIDMGSTTVDPWSLKAYWRVLSLEYSQCQIMAHIESSWITLPAYCSCRLSELHSENHPGTVIQA